MTEADLDGDGWPDVIIGAMRLQNIAQIQRGLGATRERGPDPILLFENRMRRRR